MCDHLGLNLPLLLIRQIYEYMYLRQVVPEAREARAVMVDHAVVKALQGVTKFCPGGQVHHAHAGMTDTTTAPFSKLLMLAGDHIIRHLMLAELGALGREGPRADGG